MSVSKWAYDPEKCDGHYCCGDCDYCELDESTEQDDELEAQEIKDGRRWGE